VPIALVLAALAFVFLLLALIPSRRLLHAGVPLWPRVVYLVLLVLLGVAAFELRPLARYLLPLIVLLFLLPFSGLPERWSRWRRRTSRGDGGGGGGPGAGEGGSPPTGASRVPRGWARNTPPESIIDGQAVRLEPDEPKQP
jgi:hypothetical protein